MSEIFGVSYRDDQKLRSLLMAIEGIGVSTANEICNYRGYTEKTQLRDIDEEEFSALVAQIGHDFTIGPELHKHRKSLIEGLLKIKCYRGRRHQLGLPVRGQRTKSNAQTVRRLHIPKKGNSV